MGLAERLDQARAARPASGNGPGEDALGAPTQLQVRDEDPLAELRDHIKETLLTRMGASLYDTNLTEAQLRATVQRELNAAIAEERAPLSPTERARLLDEVSRDIHGYGPIQPFLEDDTVTEVMANGTDGIYIERAGRLYRTDTRFLTEEHLRRVIERIVSEVGRRIDESSPMVDARLPDGSRVNAVIPPLAVHGPALTIRKFSRDPYTVDDLIEFRTLAPEVASFLEAAVRGRLSVLVSGGTGTGKTTLLNVLSSFIPKDERIVTIEDAVELQLHQDHVISLESRPPNIEGRGEVTIRDLVRNALRMRPDRIIVGEVRGAEALDMLQAMNTGHEGSLSTIHANSPRDALARIETMVLMAGLDLPVRAIREQVSAAIDVVVQLGRLADGSRRVLQVSEIQSMEGDVVTMQDIFAFDWAPGRDADGRFVGTIRPTGIRPAFVQHLADVGVELPPGLFGDEGGEIITEHLRRRGGR